MKKICSLLLAVLLLCSCFVGCSPKETETLYNSVAEKEDAQEAKKVNTKKDVDVTNIINSSTQEKFSVNVDASGEVKENTLPISSKEIIIDSKTYEFPINGSDLLDDGWYWETDTTYDDEIEPGTIDMIGFNLVKGNSKIEVSSVTNSTGDVCGFKDCKVNAVIIRPDYILGDCEIVIGGGITPKSTALDVLNYFGNPNDKTDFTNGYNTEDILKYENHKKSYMDYNFKFFEDGNIEHFSLGTNLR